MGTSSPVTGLIAYSPMNIPSFSFVSSVLWNLSCMTIRSMNLFTRSSYSVPFTSSITFGCSGAKTMNVTPQSVSTLVVKMGMISPVRLSLKLMRVPSDLPIQFSCMSLTLSGHPSSFLISLRSSSAYPVILKNHCSRFLTWTFDSQRQHELLITCSLARTVWHFSHQLMGASFLYASPFSSILRNIH